MSQANPVIIWLRRDLRLADNPALHAGVQSGKPLILLYIDETNRGRALGAASKVWLHHSLISLSNSISEKGCLLYTSPSPRDKRQSRMPSSA